MTAKLATLVRAREAQPEALPLAAGQSPVPPPQQGEAPQPNAQPGR